MSLPCATPEEFRQSWNRFGRELVEWSAESFANVSLLDSSREWLTNAGLPPSALPYIRFEITGSSTVRARSGSPPDERYLVIGTCNDGDLIAIDMKGNDSIHWLDSENNFDPGFFNSSIAELLNSLLIYREFVINIKNTRGESAYSKSDFTDLEFDALRNGLMQNDPHCLAEGSFWKIQLDMDLQLRREGQG
jgi:hypothetical protein